jgi:hypothetical protein
MNPQKIILVNIDTNTETFLRTKMEEGYVIQHIQSLLPTYTKLLIIYVEPFTEPT